MALVSYSEETAIRFICINVCILWLYVSNVIQSVSVTIALSVMTISGYSDNAHKDHGVPVVGFFNRSLV